MSEIIESIEVDVPVRTAYDQWTQFEEFPRFMDGVESVAQVDNTTLEFNHAGRRHGEALAGEDHGAGPGQAHRLDGD